MHGQASRRDGPSAHAMSPVTRQLHSMPFSSPVSMLLSRKSSLMTRLGGSEASPVMARSKSTVPGFRIELPLSLRISSFLFLTSIFDRACAPLSVMLLPAKLTLMMLELIESASASSVAPLSPMHPTLHHAFCQTILRAQTSFIIHRVLTNGDVHVCSCEEFESQDGGPIGAGAQGLREERH